METYKCLECGNDLTDGVTLFTKSNVFNENMRFNKIILYMVDGATITLIAN